MIPVVGMKPVVLAQWSADLPFPLQVSGSTPHGIARCTRKVMRKSKKQGAVATSTSEAEFVSASKAADEIVWERRILAALNIRQNSPTPLHEDKNLFVKLFLSNYRTSYMYY